MKDKQIGFAITGSHCTFAAIVDPLKRLVEGGNRVIPIISASVAGTSTRFGQAGEWSSAFEEICRHRLIDSIKEAEEIATNKLDVVVVAPCTGNTLAKLANAITDTPVTMVAKAQLRNERPLVLAISTNDGLAGNAVNIGRLLDKKNVYFVPFAQDNPQEKPRSLVCNMSLLADTIDNAIKGKQIQPILLR